MKRVLICHIIPQDYIVAVKGSQAANNFCLNLINNSCFSKAISIIPISYSIPHNIHNSAKIIYKVLNYKNKFLSVLNYIYISITTAVELMKYKHIWFYNIVPSSMLLYFILRFIFRNKVYVIIADHTPHNQLTRWEFYAEKFIKKSSGTINLSYRSLVQHPNNISIAGIVPTYTIRKLERKAINRKRFLFSGTINEVTGIDLALNFFSKYEEYELFITGNGSIPEQYKNKSNIHFLGLLQLPDYQKILNDIDICLSFRNPYLTENLNNFPSKILEYFSNNKIVISTINYPELKDFNYIKTNYDVESILEAIYNIPLNDDEIHKWFINNNNQLINSFSEQKWEKSFIQIELNN